MFNFLRELIAVPIRILLWLTGMVPVVNPVAIAKLLWETSGLIEDGEVFLKYLINTQGLEDGRQAADAMFAQTNDARFIAAIAYAEYASGNIEGAQQWVDHALKAGCVNPERLLFIQFITANSRHDNEKSRECIQKIYERNDLPMGYSALAHPLRAYYLFRDGDLDAALEVAERILQIRDDLHAYLIRWAMDLKAGRDEQARKNLEMARASWHGNFFPAVLADYYLILGDQDSAIRQLHEAQQEGFDPNCDPDMAALSQTQAYKNHIAKEV